MQGRLRLDQYQALNEIAPLAIEMEKEYGFPPAVLLAQWAIESGWGTKKAGKNHLFGMTYARRHPGFDWVATTEHVTAGELKRFSREEQATARFRDGAEAGQPAIDRQWLNKRWLNMRRRFAAFPTLRDGVLDYVWLIQDRHLTGDGQRYEPAWAAYKERALANDFARGEELLIRGIAKAGYATGPNYARDVLSTSRAPEVQAAIAKARAAYKPPVVS